MIQALLFLGMLLKALTDTLNNCYSSLMIQRYPLSWTSQKEQYKVLILQHLSYDIMPGHSEKWQVLCSNIRRILIGAGNIFVLQTIADFNLLIAKFNDRFHIRETNLQRMVRKKRLLCKQGMPSFSTMRFLIYFSETSNTSWSKTGYSATYETSLICNSYVTKSPSAIQSIFYSL